tara:strand:- start:1902 stop:2729 length:828 start_codon:yes stop_codon:yes gene_type:complete
MRKDKTLTIITDSKKDDLGLGDYLRIISFLPNLKFNIINWISDKKVINVAKLSDRINNFSLIQSKKEKKLIKKSDLILNLYIYKKNNKQNIYLRNILDSGDNTKQKTLNIYENLSKIFNIKKYKIYSNKKLSKTVKYDFFFNWITPKDWKIKNYPKKSWKLLEEKLRENSQKKILWQNNNDGFLNYVKKIKNSKVVISVVGLGCHLAMLFDKPLVVLAGPTYFNEIDKYKKAKIVKPNKFCKIHSKKLNVKVKSCDCMNNIKYINIFKTIKKNYA